MAIVNTLARYLKQHDIHFDVLPHAETSDARLAAQAAHVSARQVAKAVLLEDRHGFLMAVLPAGQQVNLVNLGAQLGRHLWLAKETETAQLFQDCVPGAIPPAGAAYGLETVYDNRLLQEADIYFEGGSHTDLVHISGRQFKRLIDMTKQSHYCHVG